LFIHQRIVSPFKGVVTVSDRMSHIVMRVGRCDLALIVHAPTVNRNDDSKDRFLRAIRAGVRSLSYVPHANSVRMV
jgi:hypothetical protein